MEQNIYDRIISVCKKPRELPEIFKKIDDYSKKETKQAFNKLVAQGLLRKVKQKSKKYANLSYFGIVEAKFLSTDKGYAFAEPKEELSSKRDIFIPEKYKKDAWHGDAVLVELLKTRYKKDKKGERQEGKVIKVIERNKADIIGTLKIKDNMFFVYPDFKKYPVISIDESDLHSAIVDDKVAVKISYFGNSSYMPQGKITKVLGKSGDLKTVVSSILHVHGIFRDFPKLCDIQASHIETEIPEDMFGSRLNLTDKMIFTIDGDYSKDFDDAVSLETLDNGNFYLGVHIADVSHYVTEGSPLDLEAFDRGTSVYFANEVVPMLPFKLSNGICSLNPHVNRFAMSVFMEINQNGDVVQKSFHNSVINSKYRMTYNKVNAILDGDADLIAEYSEIFENLMLMDKLSKILERKRFSKGALDLDIPECYILCDEDGEPSDIKMRERGQSEKLIEQFMVLTNETVAEFMQKNEIPSVYRVHEPPNLDKLKVFSDVAKLFGYSIKKDDLTDPLKLQKILNDSHDTVHHKVIATMLLRSLSRARYDEKCIGHSGLASDFYLHFTSPIRRYPDLAVHRMLKKAIAKARILSEDKEFVELSAIQSTARERHADEASREVEKRYMARYMAKHIGEEFTANVSGVQNFGIFVELPNTIEGLIRIEKLNDDEYTYDDETVRLVGRNFKKVYTIGTEIKVKLISSSFENGQIDFDIIK